jgi:hypothetical protein
MESVVLAGIGAMFGLVLAPWASRALVAAISTPESYIALDLSLDGRVLRRRLSHVPAGGEGWNNWRSRHCGGVLPPLLGRPRLRNQAQLRRPRSQRLPEIVYSASKAVEEPRAPSLALTFEPAATCWFDWARPSIPNGLASSPRPTSIARARGRLPEPSSIVTADRAPHESRGRAATRPAPSMPGEKCDGGDQLRHDRKSIALS